MLRYVTSLFFLLSVCVATGQIQPRPQTNPQPAVVTNDSVVYKTTYGLRAGIELGSIVRTLVDEEYSGFEIMADYRLTKHWYIAGELGTESVDRETNQIDYETSGSYITAGADYNFYRNWLDMDNMIYVGFRAGASSFTQTLNRFDFYQDNEVFQPESRFPNEEYDGLTAFWAEIQAGLKVQVLNNVYLSINVQLKRLVNEQQPDNFDNLYVPGFGRTFDTSEIGVGYSYGITYRIPFYKK